MIARRNLFAGEDDIAPFLGLSHQRLMILFRIGADFDPSKRACAFDCSAHVEPQRIRLARRDAAGALFGPKLLRHAGIERRAVGIVRPWRTRMLRDMARDGGAAFEASVDE